MSYPQKDIILYDGFCNLCNDSVRFITKRMKSGVELEFIAQNSDEGIALISKFPENIRNSNSVILLHGGKPYIRSAASLRCLKYLRQPWPILFPLGWIIPLPIRDLIYQIIVRFRHRDFSD